jgi:hypothetical protein
MNGPRGKAALMDHFRSGVGRITILLAAIVLLTIDIATASAHDVARRPILASSKATLLSSYGRVPMSFEPNLGQTASRVRFLAHGPGSTTFLTDTGAVLAISKQLGKGTSPVPPGSGLITSPASRPSAPKTITHFVRMSFVGANPRPQVSGTSELPGVANYFIGNDQTKWQTDVPTYRGVRYRSIYPGIDLSWEGKHGGLEYRFTLAPGASAGAIQMRFRGASSLRTDANGDLLVNVAGHLIRESPPHAYQRSNGMRIVVRAAYTMEPGDKVGFSVPRRDPTEPLMIDPSLVYSTYLGGSDNDDATGIALDGSGDAYVTGHTQSTDFPTKNAIQSSHAPDPGAQDAFVAELAPDGSSLVYSTYLGGSNVDVATAIAVDGTGDAYVTGHTYSGDFPTKDPIQGSKVGGIPDDAFIAELALAGSSLVYSTYLGGSGYDEASGIAVHGSGDAYVFGFTSSTDFPTVNPIQGSNTGTFVAELAPGGSSLVYSTYLGGSSGHDYIASGIAVDGSGDAYVAGYTNATDFPTKDPIQGLNAGGYDSFVAELAPGGSSLVYSTYLGGSGADWAFGIAVDGSGDAYVAGSTTSTDLPTKDPVQGSFAGNADAFAAELAPAGSSLVNSTYLGGSGGDDALAITVDGSGDTYVAGDTSSLDFPTEDPIQGSNAGSTDSFVAELAPAGSSLVYSTYLGGSGFERANGITVDGSGDAYVAGVTASPDFPTTNPIQGSLAGSYDAFVAKIAPGGGVSQPVIQGQVVEGNPGSPTNAQAWPVAMITDSDTSTPASAYTATINWGDNSQCQVPQTCGQIVGSGGVYAVDASHTYPACPKTFTSCGQSYFTTVTVSKSGALPSQGQGVAEVYALSYRLPTKPGAQQIGLLTFDTSLNQSKEEGACTATVVATPAQNQSTILTAAHCVYGDQTPFGYPQTLDHYYSNFEFAPGHADGACYQVAVTNPQCAGSKGKNNPTGAWQTCCADVDSHFLGPFEAVDGFDHSYDYAFIVLSKNAETGPYANKNLPVQQAVGGVPIAFGSMNHLKETVIGYAGADVSGTNCATGKMGGCVQTKLSCRNMSMPSATLASTPYGSKQMGQIPADGSNTCTFNKILPGGASGSAWMNSNSANTVPGIGFNLFSLGCGGVCPGEAYGPYLGGADNADLNFITAARFYGS